MKTKIKHADLKKLKKKLQLLKNKHNQMIFRSVTKMHDDADHAAEILHRPFDDILGKKKDSKSKDKGEGKDNEIWSAKLQMITSKISRKKRKAKDRWNRFAGTAGGGGRGL